MTPLGRARYRGVRCLLPLLVALSAALLALHAELRASRSACPPPAGLSIESNEEERTQLVSRERIAPRAAAAVCPSTARLTRGNGPKRRATYRPGRNQGPPVATFEVVVEPLPDPTVRMLAVVGHDSEGAEASARGWRRTSMQRDALREGFVIPNDGRMTLAIDGVGCTPCPDWLEVCTSDGLSAGGVSLGNSPDGATLRVTLEEAYGNLRLRALDRTGNDVEIASYLVRELFGDRLEREVPDDWGKDLFAFLPPGPYEVSLRGRRHYRVRNTVLIETGTTTEATLTLDAAPTAGALGGRLRTARGERSPWAMVLVRGEAEPRFCDEVEVEWNEHGGAFVGSWHVDDVPAGRYQIELSTEDDYDWGRMSVATHAPDLDVDFFCDDTAPCLDVGLRVVDATTLAPLSEAHVYWTHRGWDETRDVCTAAGRPATRLEEDWPLNAPFRFLVSASGYRLGRGQVTDFSTAEWSEDGPILVATMRLQPGGELDFLIEDEDGHPLGDVAVVVNGQERARSAPDGRVQVVTDLARDRFDFRARTLEWDGYAWGLDEEGRPEDDVWEDLPIRISMTRSGPR